MSSIVTADAGHPGIMSQFFCSQFFIWFFKVLNMKKVHVSGAVRNLLDSRNDQNCAFSCYARFQPHPLKQALG